MKKTIRNHIDTNTTTRRLAEGLILERRVTENGIDLRVMLQPTSSSTWWKSTGAWRMLPSFSSWPLEKPAKICYADTETRRRSADRHTPPGGAGASPAGQCRSR